MISFHDLRNSADVIAYAAHLNTHWPERERIIQHICEQTKALLSPTPQVIELCPGPGQLAEVLLKELPLATYTGVDFSEPLLTFARERLASFGNRARLIRANLNEDDWLDQVSREIHAIVSLQSLHDLGDEGQVNRIYGLARSLLMPGGLFLNADLVVSPQQDAPNNPGRRSIARHIELLQAHGYEHVSCTLELGEFGCVVGFAPPSST